MPLSRPSETTSSLYKARSRSQYWTESEERELVVANGQETWVLEGKAAGPGGSVHRPSKAAKAAALARIATHIKAQYVNFYAVNYNIAHTINYARSLY